MNSDTMEDWTSKLRHKVVSASEAVRKIQPGQTIYAGHGLAAAFPVLEALAEANESIGPIEVFTLNSMGQHPLLSKFPEEGLKVRSVFFGNPERQAYALNKNIDYIPAQVSEFHRLLEKGLIKLDVAIVQMTPPNANGFMSFGIDVGYSLSAIQHAKMVIIEANVQMPFTYGESLHVDEVDWIIASDRKLPELPRADSTEISKRIGQHIALIIEDGSNLQVGVGAIPDAVLDALKERADIGIHTELFTEGLVDLHKSGVINNRFNNLNPGKSVCTFVYGTQRVYDFLDHCEDVLIKPASYTNSIFTAGKINKLISINAAVEVDLFGQINAETIRGKQYSGVGGQVDFARAAAISPGGKSIIALSSTAKKGEASRIVFQFEPGNCVTTPRNDVDYIVTEYGVAHLRGRTLNERAKLLINIAHPRFREMLRHKWEAHTGFKV